MTPTQTAIAKSVITVTPETSTITKASDNGTRFIILKLAHSNVPSTTINITPTSAASGIISIKLEAKMINASNINAALIPDKRERPPELILIIDWPIIAQPPIAPKKPHVIFAAPWPIHSLLLWPRVSVISSIKLSVNNDSIRPIAASISA